MRMRCIQPTGLPRFPQTRRATVCNQLRMFCVTNCNELREVHPKDWTRPVSFEATVMKHLKSRKHHSKAFRKQAVELLLTGKTLQDLSEELGIARSSLSRWRDEYLADMAELPNDTLEMPPHKMVQE